MKEQNLLTLINVNRDAIATNRGFYFQYLTVVKKWLENFISNIDKQIFTEFDDDIKEVGTDLIFTQIKCYSSTFSFQSKEIKKAILNFFALYIKNKDKVSDLKFNFLTNTKVSSTETTLLKWISEQPITTPDLLDVCCKKISDILIDEIQKKIEKKLSKDHENSSFTISDFDDIIHNAQLIQNFTQSIFWSFDEIPPEEAILSLTAEIHSLLQNSIFKQRPVKLLLESLLCEIYRRSQEENPEHRKVTNSLLQNILDSKDSELTKYIDIRFISLLNSRLDILEDKVGDIQSILQNTIKVQEHHGEILNKITSDSKNTDLVIPHLITTIPYINVDNIYRRRDIISTIRQDLSENKHVSVNGNGGMGKSIIIKSFTHAYHSEYDHVLWINAESGLVNNLNTNQAIRSTFNIPDLDLENYADRFNLIVNKLNEVQGQNLLIIDSYDVAEPEMKELKSLQNWHIILGTRLKLDEWKDRPIPPLDFDEAKNLYTSISDQESVDEQLLKELFKFVEYNTLVISLVAQTIGQSFTLTLEDVLKHFKEKSLDDTNVQVDLQNDYGESLTLLKILNKTFDLKKLEDTDKYYLSFFALLPLEETNFKDLVDWYGKDDVANHTIAFTNVLNSLHRKGLLERNGKSITMHKMLRESVLYQERTNDYPFSNQTFNIYNLSVRINEGYKHDLSKALRFLKYGEAILKEIKEPYRKAVYQPLLQLENEVLNIYGWLRKESFMVQCQDLYNRAEKYLDKNDILLGIIANNLALALVTTGEVNLAFTYFEKSIDILSTEDSSTIPHLLISICNMSSLLLKLGDFPLFFQYFKKIEELRQKYNLLDDVSLPIQTEILATAYCELGNFDKAIKLYRTAIELHKNLPVEHKNDIFLVIYHIKLGYAYVSNKDLENASMAARIAGTIFVDLNLIELNHHIEILKLMIIIAGLEGDEEAVKELGEVLKTMQN